ncbi:MAG: two-component sensor histidine kinase [Myxococcales bacterium]|nr:MAG: two-component sensor histidine kinase [Myxococcales bacterium]
MAQIGLVAGSEDHKRGFRRIVALLVWLVIVPTALLLLLGVMMLVFWQAQLNVLFGIMVVTLVGCLVTGTVLSLVFLRKEANLSKLQLDFVSKVSHELRTPLTAIRMFVDMLQEDKGSDPEKMQKCLDVLQKETVRLSERIERLVDWGRMEAGRRIYHPKREKIEPIINDALAAFGGITLGQGPHPEVMMQPDLPDILVDRSALVDALVNLLSNAYKYTGDDKQIALQVITDTQHVRFSVSDNGVGIPGREHHRIFQKFYRVDERLSRTVEGSGLGLAIVRHVADAHRGSVEVDSELGEGSTFTMIFPRQQWDDVPQSEDS